MFNNLHVAKVLAFESLLCAVLAGVFEIVPAKMSLEQA